jgi:hypothetical protein
MPTTLYCGAASGGGNDGHDEPTVSGVQLQNPLASQTHEQPCSQSS